MPTLFSTARRVMLENRLSTKEVQLAALYTAYDEAIAGAKIDSYTFDSGDARQMAKYRRPETIQKSIAILEAEIDSLWMKLSGFGVIRIQLRRKFN